MKLLPLALLATLLPTPAMAQDTRSFAAAGFDRIAVQGCDHVAITFGAGFSVRAQGQAGSLAAIGVAVRGRVLTLAGQSAAAARLIPALTAAPTLRDPAFSAPITRNEATQAELFSIRAMVAP